MKTIKYLLKCCAALICVLLSTIATQAQTNMVAGRVTDSKTKQPIEFAVINLINADSVIKGGAISDENGFFKIEEVKFDNYHLKVKFIGYNAKFTPNFTISAEKPTKFFRQIPLTAYDNQLKETVVKGQKNFVTNSIDRKSYNVEDMTINKGSSVTEILEVIPSVDVDIDGNLSLRGSSNLTVLIDGKRTMISNSDLQTLFETLPANSIKKIEVITNPSAKYDPDGMAGIINIVTKKNKLEGFFGNVNVGAAYNGRYNLGGMLSIKQGKWSTMLNAGFRYRDQFSNGTTFRRNISDTNTILDQFNDGTHTGLGGRVSFSLAYQLDKSADITFSASSNIHNMERSDRISYQNSIENQNPFNKYYRDTETDFAMNFNNYKVDYQKTLKGKDHYLKASVMMNQFSMDMNSTFLQSLNEINPDDWALLQQKNNSTAEIPSYIGQIDYEKPLKKNGFLELGAKSINKSGTADLVAELYDSTLGAWIKEDLWSNKYKIDEGIHSVYGVYKQSFKKFGYQVGLRLEKAFTDAYLLESSDTFHNEYFSPFPSAHLSYNISKVQQLKASYSRRVNRPNERAMRPFTDYSDPLNVRQGNPFLLPEYINSYEIEHSMRKGKLMVTSAAYLKDIEGMITRVKTVEDGVATTTFQNLGSGRNYGLELIINARPNRKFNFTLSSNAFQTEIDGGADSELNAEGFMVSSKLFTTYRFKRNYTLQLSGRYRTPRIIPQGEISSIYYTDIALQKKILKNKGSINFKVSDVFNTREFAFTTEGSTFFQESYRKRESRFYQLAFSYNFGEFKPSGRRRSSSSKGGDRNSGSGESGVEID